MSSPINPLVDYAFKRLLGDPRHVDILIDFLNAILRPDPPIRQVAILNPFNPKAFQDDKLTVVDVKAVDEARRTYQIEVQLSLLRTLKARALYSWARLHADQLVEGQDYGLVRPTIAIWVLDGVLFRERDEVHLRFRLSDDRLGLVFNDQLELHMLQLGCFSLPQALDAESEWVYFLKEARRWTELPAALHTPALRKAMDQLKTIRQSKEDLAHYRAREDYQRWELTKERERQRLDEELAAAREALEVAEYQRQEAERERERLRERLRAAGIDPVA